MQGLCGQCKHHKRDNDGEWVCGNEESDYYSDWTTWSDGCGSCEERED